MKPLKGGSGKQLREDLKQRQRRSGANTTLTNDVVQACIESVSRLSILLTTQTEHGAI